MEILQESYQSGLVRPELLRNEEYLGSLWERNVKGLLEAGVHVLVLGSDGEVARGRYKDELRRDTMFFPQPEEFSVRGLMEPFITDGRLTKDQWAILSRKLGERFQRGYRMEFNPARVEAYSCVVMPQRPFANYGQSEKLMGVSVKEGRNRLSGDQIEECGPFNDGLFYWLAFPEVLRIRYLSFPGSDYRGMSDTSYAPAVGFDQTFLMGAFGPEVTLKPVDKAAYGESGLFTRGKVQS